jgi:hypothetical protein
MAGRNNKGQYFPFGLAQKKPRFPEAFIEVEI